MIGKIIFLKKKDHFDEVKDYANVIEHRQDDDYWTKERALEKNEYPNEKMS